MKGMELRIPDDLAKAILAVANATGVPAEKLAHEALRAHFPSPPEALRQEFEAWERAAEEDASKLQLD
jgi:predicted transcriptional regulator